MVDLNQFTTNLTRDASGLWVAASHREVSYPSDGNQTCFALEESSFWFNHRNDIITSVVRQFSPEQTFFDIGGGNGYVALALQRAGIDTVVVEPGPHGARNALGRGIQNVVQSTLEDAGFKPQSIGAAGLFDVLEHVSDDYGFLVSIHRYLRPGAFMFITVPAHEALWSEEDHMAGHFRRYTRDQLSQQLSKAGFSVAFTSYLFWCLVPAVFLFRSLPSRLGLRKSGSPEVAVAEHTGGGILAGSLVGRMLSLELARLRKGKTIPVGTSCLAVARKVDRT